MKSISKNKTNKNNTKCKSCNPKKMIKLGLKRTTKCHFGINQGIILRLVQLCAISLRLMLLLGSSVVCIHILDFNPKRKVSQ